MDVSLLKKIWEQVEKIFSWNSQNPCNIAYKEGSQIGDQIQKITCGDLKSEF